MHTKIKVVYSSHNIEHEMKERYTMIFLIKLKQIS